MLILLAELLVFTFYAGYMHNPLSTCECIQQFRHRSRLTVSGNLVLIAVRILLCLALYIWQGKYVYAALEYV